jgi:hypothetical protein
MKRTALAFLTLAAILGMTSCVPPDTPARREKAIQNLYDKILKTSTGLNGWNYTYHPMILAAWEHKSRGRINSRIEALLESGNDTFQALSAEVSAQAAEGGETLNMDRFGSVISDQAVRDATVSLVREGVPAVHAYARAYMQSIIPGNSELPGQILIQLAKLYAEDPSLLEVPTGETTETDQTRWRDWLHDALAGCGLAGVLTALDFDHQIEDMQKYVEEDFWEGRLSIAYNLRGIQLARSQALEAILREIEPYRKGGKVSGFHDWMYYNLAWSLHDTGGLFPYTEQDRQRIDTFLQEGLETGPLGDGEEAQAIAKAIGKAPSTDEAGRLFGMINRENLPCERKQLAYTGLAAMFLVDLGSWAPDPTSQEWLRNGVMGIVEKGALPCGNGPLFKFYEAVLTGFTKNTGPQYPGSLFSDEQLIKMHETFIGLLPGFKSADDRASALYLLLYGFLQTEFMMRHPELGRYRDTLLQIYDDWSTTTTFENASIGEEDFRSLLQDFRDSLGTNTWAE